jgi:uncharacterized protein
MAPVQTATLMRIFVNESERYDKRPLFMAIVEELQRQDFAGAIVLKGIEGYGARGHVHALRSFDQSTDLPILIEVAESRERIAAIVPLLQEMIPEGLITLEQITMTVIRKPA